jgi:hypothetical protein
LARPKVAAILNTVNPWQYSLPPRWVTSLLEDHGLTKPTNAPDAHVYAEQMITRVWEAVTTGQVVWGDGEVMKLRARDWLDTVDFIMTRIEGPPEQKVTLTLVREKAEEIALQYGLSTEELMAEAERLALPAGVRDASGQ